MSKQMNSFGEEDADNWVGVQDPRKRKQIQDRLAQRARRRRLAESSNQTQAVAPVRLDHDSSRPFTGGQYDVALWLGTKTTSPSSGPSSSTEDSSPASSSSSMLSIPSSPPSVTPMTSDQKMFPMAHISVYGAMFINGALLGIPCGSSTTPPSKSDPVCTSKIPVALRPTPVQLTTLHVRWIDRFPFPRMRDNMIILSGIIDEEGFLADLFIMPSFTLAPGSKSWDPGAWKIGKEFAEKWGYLFC